MAQGQQQRPGASAPAPSRTTTESPQQPQSREEAPRILRLRGARNTSGRSVQWAEDVVDNEGLGRKSSKVCCIYHRPKAVDESSDESSSDESDSSSGNDWDADADRKGKGHACGGGHSHSQRGKQSGGKKPRRKRSPSPNAYEKVPKSKPKPRGQSGMSES